MAGLSETKDGAGQGEHDKPDQHTSALYSLLGLQGDDFHRVADAQVPVDRDAREEEDGTVEVEVEEEADQAAHEVSEDPAVSHDVTGHEERQRQAVHEVRRGQIDHVDQGSVPALGSPEGTVEDHRVEGDAEEEGERVTDGEEDVLVGLVDAAERRRSGGGRGGAEEGVGDGDVGWSGAPGGHRGVKRSSRELKKAAGVGVL